MNKQKTFQLVNPFSDAFIENWSLWKDYKWEAHKFKYKGVISEQMALKHLVQLSEGQEEKAVKIIEQSIRRLWQGFFPLHETTTGKKDGHTKSKQQSAPKGQPNGDSLEDRVKNEFIKRNGEWEQDPNGSNLKAV